MTQFHQFNIEEAKELGVEAAAILFQFRSILDVYKKLDTNFIEDKYWIELSTTSLEELFPYIEKGKLKRLLYRLVEKGFVQKKEFSSQKSKNSVWYSMPEIGKVSVLPHTNQTESDVPIIDMSQARQQAQPAAKKQFCWEDILPAAIEQEVASLIASNGYDRDFYMDIWQTFAAKMDSDGERVPTMDIARKRFKAYARKVMIGFKQGNYRYNQTVQRKEQERKKLVEKWLSLKGKPDMQLVNNVNTSTLRTPIVQVWDSFINKAFEQEIPLKHYSQVEIGFNSYLNTWISNENKAYFTGGSTAKPQVNFDDTSWADGLDLEG
ncbi:hypothetical protein [Thalassotalea marina]|uniref:Replication protein n=1 Tax=Thalassotalea marina TaxID=1673741 RepID=A0A919BDQ1_9GAMM|nr:hypothetical protein [Thalassotalea marina]GHF81712.1 hypothetical protein GCM10017161_06490 [Thalassotalea marina]